MKQTFARLTLIFLIPFHFVLHTLLEPFTSLDVWLIKWCVYLIKIARDEDNDRN